MMFAQLETVPSEFLKWFVVIAFALVTAVIIPIWLSRKSGKVEIEHQPVEVRKSPKRYNHEQSEQRFGEVSRRLDGHDAELEQLWKTMRDEDAAIREKNGERFEEIMRALGRIEGELKSK